MARVLAEYPYRFAVAQSPQQRAEAFRLRGAVTGTGWDEDGYDEAALQVLGRDEAGVLVSTGRIVLPPGPLPTEDVCGIVVEPAGRVADVGRMCVAPAYRSYRQAAFVALLCALYRQIRRRGHPVACGMMSSQVRRLVRLLGLDLVELGPDREYLGEARAPVRFQLVASAVRPE